MRLRIIIITVLILTSLMAGCGLAPDLGRPDASSSVTTAFERRKSDVQVEGKGIVTRVLSDDHEGSRHQRFIVQLASGQTVLIQHNIDLAPRVADLKEGDTISFFGEYVWNEQGGLVHWTHNDPAGKHVGGWIRRNGKIYQ